MSLKFFTNNQFFSHKRAQHNLAFKHVLYKKKNKKYTTYHLVFVKNITPYRKATIKKKN
ncbi:hypothetical protein HanXRQr2_Chr08g0359421 [Helianthus annuus]|uniref:Uncharacterized protein n=1 Tax=Helianthus annuus TaxID=4232 RepID=A0A251U9L2_HELAN|nr:hypothetical protein HanXRQr2_Chr08g0359421 [Helianthus annuus]KAJ0959387.1 hypothetical protein HanPSC8_Chr00c139g0805121 [Helianthus annuus]